MSTYKDATSPAINAVAVTPSNTDVLDPPCKSLYVGVAGNLALVLADDSAAVTFVGVSVGQILPVRAKQVLATGTTASSIVALY